MEEETHIPATAKEVRVTNVIDPYYIRIYEVENHTEQLNQLEKKLDHLARKTELNEYGAGCEPEIGDLVLIGSSGNDSPFNVDLPAWYCRGVVLHGKTRNSKYPVMLVDHGIVLHFWIEELRILPPSSISTEFLTTTIGIGNILPIAVENKVARFSDHWSKLAIQFTREIIEASTATYFDHRTSDKFGNRYGELYLIIENEIEPLGKSLACNLFGTMLNYDLVESKKEPDAPASQASTTSDDQPRSTTSMGEDFVQKRNDVEKTNRLSKSDRQIDPDQRILICSTVKCKPIYSVDEAGFHSRLQKALRSFPISRPMPIQEYLWPAICRRLNVVAIAPPKSGKTMSYLIPIISFVTTNKKNPQLTRASGPFAIILCVSSREVDRIFRTCCKILNDSENTKDSIAVLPAYNGIPEKTIVAKIYNGCDILISTPPYLSRLIKSNRRLLIFDRLSHMVFDGADVILGKYNKSLAPIFKIPPAVEKIRRGLASRIKLQMIAVAQYWTDRVKILVEGIIKDPYVCIPSYMEAAVYAALKPKFIMQPKDQKAAKVVELLGTQWTMIKTIIVCVTTEEAKELAQFLRENSIDTSLVHEEMIFTESKGIRETWMAMVSGKYFVLVCTDPVVSVLDIKDADCLIHYSIAARSKTQFFHRFSTLIDNFSRHVRSKEKPKPRFILLVDETNESQLNGVVTMIRRLGGEIPGPLEAMLEKIIHTVEMAKTDRRLCKDLKAFGSCPNKDSCASRHCFIPEIDKPMTEIRSNDWVKLHVISFHSTNHYSARILEYNPSGTKEWIPFSFKEFGNLAIEMQKHFLDPASRRSAKIVNIGDICAFEEAPGVFKRVQVLSSVDKDEIRTQLVDVRRIDDGGIVSIQACHLLEVPDELAKWPSHVVDIYLARIIPFDNEPAWSPCAENIVDEWFNEGLGYSNACVFGKVMLHISHNMWVDPLEIRHELHGPYPDLVDSFLKTILIREKCALENTKHVENLLKLCRRSGIETSRTTVGTN